MRRAMHHDVDQKPHSADKIKQAMMVGMLHLEVGQEVGLNERMRSSDRRMDRASQFDIRIGHDIKPSKFLHWRNRGRRY